MKKRTAKYFKEYKVSNILSMIRNNRRTPHACDEDFSGKLVVITGATSGIGYATAKKYAAHGAKILCINRNREKSESLKAELMETFGAECEYLLADLSVMEDVLRVAEELKNLEEAIDVLIHNAGVFLTKQEFTAEGIDKVFMVQHLASFVINRIVLDKLKAQEQARILLVNSEGHRFAAWGLDLDDLNWEKRRYTGLKSYGSAKLAQLLSMYGFLEDIEGTGVRINAMHPGAVKTETGQENGRLYKWYKRNILDRTLRPVSISADALYYLGASEDVKDVNGAFFNLTTIEEPAPPALDREEAKKVWEISARCLVPGA